MSLFEALIAEAIADRTLVVTLLLLVALLAMRVTSPDRLTRQKPLYFLYAIHVLCLLIAAVQAWVGTGAYLEFRLPAQVAGGVVMVGSAAGLLFNLLLPRVRLAVPRIVQDVIVAVASIIAGVTVASRAGVNLSGLIATSAVFTAVLGFSLQDVIGNVAGGLALQVDNSIEVGDWIRLNDLEGKVTEIRWRYTALETRNWDTVLVPNAQLMKSNVVVIGRRTGRPQQSRRWVYFNVDWRYQPSDVITTIGNALLQSKVKHIAADPQPHCVLVEMGDSFGRYAVRYWLGDVSSDTATDSEVRTLIYFALQRANIPLSMPANAVFVTQESADRAAIKTQQQVQRRASVLGKLDLFQSLSDEERGELARGMRYTPFAPGEVMTRQGAEAHWLYILEEGRVAVRVSDRGIEKEVAQIEAPAFFGEMSLMTGEPRSATVVAISDAECFRLDKTTFQQVLRARPQLAETVAAVLTRRRAELLAVREGLDAEASMRRLAASEKDLLDRIRGFFGLMN